jgi:hypothetical protein
VTCCARSEAAERRAGIEAGVDADEGASSGTLGIALMDVAVVAGLGLLLARRALRELPDPFPQAIEEVEVMSQQSKPSDDATRPGRARTRRCRRWRRRRGLNHPPGRC